MSKSKNQKDIKVRTHEAENAAREQREWANKHYTNEQLADPMICPRSLARKISAARRGKK